MYQKVYDAMRHIMQLVYRHKLASIFRSAREILFPAGLVIGIRSVFCIPFSLPNL